MEEVVSLPTLEVLRDHVREVLCARDQLDPAQTPLSQWVLTRSGRPCGLLFELQGPRRVRTSAVWAAEEARIRFYDSAGQPFAQTRLSEGPDPLGLARP
jgi:hypothetical protein